MSLIASIIENKVRSLISQGIALKAAEVGVEPGNIQLRLSLEAGVKYHFLQDYKPLCECTFLEAAGLKKDGLGYQSMAEPHIHKGLLRIAERESIPTHAINGVLVQLEELHLALYNGYEFVKEISVEELL